MLCQLSYSHRRNFIIATGGEKERQAARRNSRAMGGLKSIEDCAGLRPGLDGRGARRHMSRASTAEGGRGHMAAAWTTGYLNDEFL